MYKVKLLRDKLGPRQWEHPDKKSALRRVLALADLHGHCYIEQKGNEFVVDASDWYGGSHVERRPEGKGANKEQANGDWVKDASEDQYPSTITYSKGVVKSDDVMHRSREQTGKRWFNVYTGPIMCGSEERVIEVSVDATEEEIWEVVIEKFGDNVWKVYEVDVSGEHKIRMW